MVELVTKTDLAASTAALTASLAALGNELAATREHLIEQLTLRLTVRLGGLVVAGVAVLQRIW